MAAQLGIPELSPGIFARHPLVYIMEAADDICYQIMDLEDAHKLKIVSLSEVSGLLLDFFPAGRRPRIERSMGRLDDPNEKIGYLRSIVIGEMVESCAEVFFAAEESVLRGDCRQGLIAGMDARLRDAYAACAEVAANRIYCAPDVVNIELAGNHIITSLMEALAEAVTNPDRNYSRLLLNAVPRQYDTRAESLYGRLQSVLDHISGMTDVYALDLYRKLNGHSLPAV